MRLLQVSQPRCLERCAYQYSSFQDHWSYIGHCWSLHPHLVGVLLPELQETKEQPGELREALIVSGQRQRARGSQEREPLLEIAEPAERREVQAPILAEVDLDAKVIAS